MLPKSQSQLPRTPYESSRDKIIAACEELQRLCVADGLAGHDQIRENVNSIKACFSDGTSQTKKYNKILELTQSIEQQLRSELEKAENDNNSVKVTGLVAQKIAKIKEELKCIEKIGNNIAGVLPLKRESQPNLEAEVPPILAAAIPTTSPTNNALQELEVSKQQVDTLSRQLTLLRSQLEEKQTQNTQLDADKQQLSDKNKSLLTETQKLNLSLEEAIRANKVLSTTVATADRKNLELSNENSDLKTQLSEIQTNQTANNNTIVQLRGAISTLKVEALGSEKQFSEKEEEIVGLKLGHEQEIAGLKLGHEQEIAGLNLQHEGETRSLKATLEALKEPLNTQREKLESSTKDNKTLQEQSEEYQKTIAALTEQLARSSKENVDLQTILRETKKEMEAARTSVNVSSDKISTLNELQKQLQENNADLEAKITGLQQQIIDQKPQTIPANDQQSNIDELTKAKAALAEQLSKSQAQHRSEIEAVRTSLKVSLTENVDLKTQVHGLTEENSVLRENLLNVNEKATLLETQSTAHLENAMGRFSEIQKLKEQMSKMAAEEQLATASSATINSTIITLEESKQELTAENVDLKKQLDGLAEENAVLRENLRDTKEKVESLEQTSNTHLENAMARFDEIKALKEQMSKMEEAAQQLATASSANMANMADRIRELEQREQRLAVENTILKKQLQKSKPTTAAPLSFSKQRISGIALRRPDELSETEPLPSITLVIPASPILTTEPINPPTTETPTRPSLLGDIAQEFKTVTPTVSGGGKVVNIEQIQKEGEKDTDRPYFDIANTKAIDLDTTTKLQTLFDDGKLNFSDQTNPNKITFINESMDPSDLQAMVAILQATSKDNKESTLNNVEVILTGKDEDLIQVLQQFHAKLAEAVQGNEDEKICAIKIQDKGGHSEELTDLIKLHNAAADIIHNREELTSDKQNNILEAIQALQAQATKSPEPTNVTRRNSSRSSAK